MIGIIYKYTSPSNKVYIGQTTREDARRRVWFGKGKYTGGYSKIDRAREKYGTHNFKYEVLFSREYQFTSDAIEELNNLESYYIGLYNSYIDGYNSTIGGDGTRGYKLNTIHKEKISKSTKGRNKPIGFGEKISLRLKGKPKSKAHREKLSKAKTNSGKKIVQYTKDGEYVKTWSSIDEVSTYLNVSRESIAGCCRGKSKTAHNYKWKYK